MLDEPQRLRGQLRIQKRNDVVSFGASLAQMFSAKVLAKSPIVYIEAANNAKKTAFVDAIAAGIIGDPSISENRPHSFFETRSDEASSDFVYHMARTENDALVGFQLRSNFKQALTQENFEKMRERLLGVFPDAEGHVTFLTSMWPSRSYDAADLCLSYHRPERKSWEMEGEIVINPSVFDAGIAAQVLNSKLVRTM